MFSLAVKLHHHLCCVLQDLNSDERYHMELHFSPGAYTSCDEPTEPRGMGYRPKHCPQVSGATDLNTALRLEGLLTQTLTTGEWGY